MARKKRRGNSLAGYFRKVFAERPDWLEGSSNAPILVRYRADHGLSGDEAVDKKIASNLANIKSVLRKKLRDQGKGGTKAAKAAGRGVSRLEALEEMVDDALSLAKGLDREGLQDVIALLRRARNQVVWKMGQAV